MAMLRYLKMFRDNLVQVLESVCQICRLLCSNITQIMEETVAVGALVLTTLDPVTVAAPPAIPVAQLMQTDRGGSK